MTIILLPTHREQLTRRTLMDAGLVIDTVRHGARMLNVARVPAKVVALRGEFISCEDIFAFARRPQ